MKQTLLIAMGALILGSCGSETNNTSEQESKSQNARKTLGEADVSATEPEIPKPSAEFITRDSVKPISKNELEGLSGFERDSLEMRIKFQEEVNKMNRAFKNSDFKSYAKFILPSIVKKRGLNTIISTLEKEQKERPLNYTSIISGPMLNIADVIDQKGNSSGWYCVMPHQSTIVQNGQEMRAEGYLVGFSPDMKRCYFTDITRKTDEEVLFLMPDLQYISEILPPR